MTGSGPNAEGGGSEPGAVCADAAAIEVNAANATAGRLLMTIPPPTPPAQNSVREFEHCRCDRLATPRGATPLGAPVDMRGATRGKGRILLTPGRFRRGSIGVP